MKLIIDGCDFTGKTTLINQLKNYYNDDDLSIIHFSYRDRRDYEFYKTMLDKTNFIADRHFLDEAIYPEVFNRKPELDEEDINLLLHKCKKEDVKILILTCSSEELIKRSKFRPDEESQVLESLLYINKKYIELADKYELTIIDTTIYTLADVVDLLERKENEKYKSNVLK